MSVQRQVQFHIQLEGVSSVLKNKRLKVPSYQRSYAWEEENVDALLTDIIEAIKNNEPEYFLGSLVITGSGTARFEVVDGQQRLTTISLIISAIKDFFNDKGDTSAAREISSDFLAKTDRRTKEKEPKLILNETDNDIYQKIIDGFLNVKESEATRQSHKKLFHAANYIKIYITTIAKKSDDSDTMLHNLLDYLESNLKVIVVTAPDDSNAFVIFETLNDRGLDLAISDLLKNYLFLKSGDKIEETKNRWLSMVAILEATSEDASVVTYLRQVAMSRYGLVRERELFSFLKKKITSKASALEFSNDLMESSKKYSALLNTDHEFWDSYDKSVRDSVDALNLLNMKQIRPLLLAVISNCSSKDVGVIFKKLVAVAVRFQIVGGVGGGALEKIYSDTAKSLTEGKIKTDKEIISAFSTLPNDSAFEQAFSVASISKSTLARFYLRNIEVYLEKNKDPEKTVISDGAKVNLEHILPLNPSNEWNSAFKEDDLRAYQRRIGNMTLLAAKPNSTAGNDTFANKKTYYTNSHLEINQAVARSSMWTKTEIENRQIDFAKLASKI
jgi:uncharacterized protein with ParB-like and HNH nuclease domain